MEEILLFISITVRRKKQPLGGAFACEFSIHFELCSLGVNVYYSRNSLLTLYMKVMSINALNSKDVKMPFYGLLRLFYKSL